MKSLRKSSARLLAQVVQWADTGSLDRQWQLVPVS
jgi:hypothetical protein